MMQWLLDENLPKDLVDWLRERGDDVLDVADSPYRGWSDRDLWELAGKQARLVMTRDLGFLHWPVRPTPLGVVMVRAPEAWRAPSIVHMVATQLATLSGEQLVGRITVVEPGGLRQRPVPARPNRHD
jgi:predicted nuclease of predicted toxin-antitoxin system